MHIEIKLPPEAIDVLETVKDHIAEKDKFSNRLRQLAAHVGGSVLFETEYDISVSFGQTAIDPEIAEGIKQTILKFCEGYFETMHTYAGALQAMSGSE